jgi:hypothetical protein
MAECYLWMVAGAVIMVYPHRLTEDKPITGGAVLGKSECELYELS